MISFQIFFFMFCYLAQSGILEEETGNKRITSKSVGPEVLSSLRLLSENIPKRERLKFCSEKRSSNT